MREKGESEIERRHSKIATSFGWFVAKIMQAVPNGFPDRFYANGNLKHVCPYCNRGRVVLIEWKRPGQPARKQQLLRHEQLRRAGVEVHVIDSVVEASNILGISDESDL